MGLKMDFDNAHSKLGDTKAHRTAQRVNYVLINMLQWSSFTLIFDLLSKGYIH